MDPATLPADPTSIRLEKVIQYTSPQAVRAALEYEWSDGQVEGQMHRLKLVKRQMYGRAKLDVLRARVLRAAQLDKDRRAR
jgi:hypothetical protein